MQQVDFDVLYGLLAVVQSSSFGPFVRGADKVVDVSFMAVKKWV